MSQGIKRIEKLNNDNKILLGKSMKTNTPCVIKTLDISKPKKLLSFRKEVEIMQILNLQSTLSSRNSPIPLDHVVHLQKAFAYKNNGYMVMERLETDLMDYVLAKGKLSEEEVKYILKKVCVGVQLCHNNNIAHLDLKPENILLSFPRAGNSHSSPLSKSSPASLFGSSLAFSSFPNAVKICDFGHSFDFSRCLDDHQIDPKKTQVKNKFRNIGTTFYRAPEISLCDGEIPIASADIWSLGIVLFIMITGFFPHVLVEKRNLPPNDPSYPSFQFILEETEENLTILNHSVMRDFATATCFDLLSKMLFIDANERLTIDDVLSHEWFEDQSCAFENKQSHFFLSKKKSKKSKLLAHDKDTLIVAVSNSNPLLSSTH